MIRPVFPGPMTHPGTRTAARVGDQVLERAVGPALAGASPVPFWLDDPGRPPRLPAFVGPARVDLAVVGGGYTGLWTALLAKERDPDRDVVVLEAAGCGEAASGRNGGFVESSLTHGFANGVARWPDEMPTLLRLGRENLDAIEATVDRHGIDCRFERTGGLTVATAAHQVAELTELAAQRQAMKEDVVLLDAAAARRRVASPTYLAALAEPDSALVEPARLAWGLRRACLAAGVRVHEGTRVDGLHRSDDGVRVSTSSLAGHGQLHAAHVVLATNAATPLLRRLSLMTVPVYDYVLVTEALTADQLDAIGWAGREGIGDAGNQFHYYRRTRDDRIVFGGYDAVYHYGSRVAARHDVRPQSFATLARHLWETFPALEGTRFRHAWGGVIDTCTRFSAFYGTAVGGRVAYALGFTGLGVAASRFAGEVVLDLLAGVSSERTALRMVRERPLPFPPEPLRWASIRATTWSLARADARGGQQNLWLRTLDRLGLGFDS